MSGTTQANVSSLSSQAFGQSCPAAHLLVGPDGRVAGLNDAMAEILGYDRQELLGRHVLEFVRPQDTAMVLEQLRQGSGSTCEPPLEVGVQVKDGTVRTLLLARCSPVPAEAQHAQSAAPPGVLLTGMDITDAKAAWELARQRELRSLRARHMEAVATLAGGVASHFQSLLDTVGECARKLRAHRPDDPDSALAVEKVLGITTHAAQITAALSGFARRGPLQLACVEPQGVIDSAIQALAPTMGGNVTLAAKVHEHLPPIFADADALVETLVELGHNARDAMTRGGTLTLAAEPVEIDETMSLLCDKELRPGRYLQFSAADTGEGMDEQTRCRAFEPFFTTRDPQRRSGLGLAKVHGCVAAHNGAVCISSSPGRGTKVAILLPAAPSASAGLSRA